MPSWIWCRQPIPSATIRSSAPAVRTAGSSDSSVMFFDPLILSVAERKAPDMRSMIFSITFTSRSGAVRRTVSTEPPRPKGLSMTMAIKTATRPRRGLHRLQSSADAGPSDRPVRPRSCSCRPIRRPMPQRGINRKGSRGLVSVMSLTRAPPCGNNPTGPSVAKTFKASRRGVPECQTPRKVPFRQSSAPAQASRSRSWCEVRWHSDYAA